MELAANYTRAAWESRLLAQVASAIVLDMLKAFLLPRLTVLPFRRSFNMNVYFCTHESWEGERGRRHLQGLVAQSPSSRVIL